MLLLLNCVFIGRSPVNSFESPWRITDLLTCDGDAGKSLWLAMSHHTWWPSFVAKLDPKVNPTVQFVNSGGDLQVRLRP